MTKIGNALTQVTGGRREPTTKQKCAVAAPSHSCCVRTVGFSAIAAITIPWAYITDRIFNRCTAWGNTFKVMCCIGTCRIGYTVSTQSSTCIVKRQCYVVVNKITCSTWASICHPKFFSLRVACAIKSRVVISRVVRYIVLRSV